MAVFRFVSCLSPAAGNASRWRPPTSQLTRLSPSAHFCGPNALNGCRCSSQHPFPPHLPPRVRRADVDVHRGLEAAGDAAVVLAELALHPLDVTTVSSNLRPLALGQGQSKQVVETSDPCYDAVSRNATFLTTAVCSARYQRLVWGIV